jgi:hypothetical protein
MSNKEDQYDGMLLALAQQHEGGVQDVSQVSCRLRLSDTDYVLPVSQDIRILCFSFPVIGHHLQLPGEENGLLHRRRRGGSRKGNFMTVMLS